MVNSEPGDGGEECNLMIVTNIEMGYQSQTTQITQHTLTTLVIPLAYPKKSVFPLENSVRTILISSHLISSTALCLYFDSVLPCTQA